MDVRATPQNAMKMTEIGEIPEDWEVVDFGESFTFLSTATNARSDLADDGNAYYIHYGDIHTRLNGNITIAAARLPSIDINKCSTASSLQLGDWVMADASEDIAGIGKVIEIVEIDSAKPVIAGLHTYALRAKNDLFAPGFKGHLGEADYLTRQYRRLMTGMKVYGVSKATLKGILLALPSVNEQKAIAAALSDADDYIRGLEKLIDKKRAIKQGAMQELLTGRRRLPGFAKSNKMKMTETGEIPEDWSISTLGGLTNAIVDGTHYTPDYVEVGVPFYSVENVTADDFQNTKFISHEEHSRLLKRCRPEKGDILLTRIGSIGKTKLIDWNVDASIYVSLALLKPNARVNTGYLYSFSRSPLFRQQIEKRALMNAVPQKINMGAISIVPIPHPVNEDEQKAIAETLSNMDDEITLLETQLDKAKQIKQAMMQELLTGRIRLV